MELHKLGQSRLHGRYHHWCSQHRGPWASEAEDSSQSTSQGLRRDCRKVWQILCLLKKKKKKKKHQILPALSGHKDARKYPKKCQEFPWVFPSPTPSLCTLTPPAPVLQHSQVILQDDLTSTVLLCYRLLSCFLQYILDL